MFVNENNVYLVYDTVINRFHLWRKAQRARKQLGRTDTVQPLTAKTLTVVLTVVLMIILTK